MILSEKTCALSALSPPGKLLNALNALNAQQNPTVLDIARKHLAAHKGANIRPNSYKAAPVETLGCPLDTVPLAADAENSLVEAVPVSAAIDALLVPYRDLISAAEIGELPKGKTIQLSAYETTTDLNFVVLAACRTFREGYYSPGRAVRCAARNQIHLL